MSSENTTTALVAPDETTVPVKIDKIDKRDEISPLREKRYQQLSNYSDGLPFSKKRYIQDAKKNLENHVLSGIAAGKKLIILKEMLEHGEFLESLKEIDISPRSANNYMNVAFRFSNLDPTLTIDLGITKLYKMLQAPEAEFQRFEQTGEFLDLSKEEMITLSTRELENHIRQYTEKSKFELQREKDKVNELFEKNQKLEKNQLELQTKLTDALTGKPKLEPIPKWWIQYERVVGEIMALATELAGNPPTPEQEPQCEIVINRLNHELAYVWKHLRPANVVDPVEFEDVRREKMAKLENDPRFDWSKFDAMNSVTQE